MSEAKRTAHCRAATLLAQLCRRNYAGATMPAQLCRRNYAGTRTVLYGE
ncbi:hypothetical protein ACSAZL_06005 [Methanosarcina sp. T3]